MEELIKKKSFNPKYFLLVRKFLVVAIGLCLGSVLVFFLVIFPKIQDIQTHRSGLEKEQKKLDQLNQKVDLLSNATGLSAFQQKNKINNLLPNAKPLLSVIHRIEAISGESGVIVSGISLNPGEISSESAQVKKKSSKAESQTDTELMDIEMTLRGSVDQINSFVSLIYSMSPLTDLSTLTLSRVQVKALIDDQPVDQSQHFEAKVVFSSYYIPSQFQVKFGQPLPDLSKFDESVLSELDQFPIVEIPTTPPNLPIDGQTKENLFE